MVRAKPYLGILGLKFGDPALLAHYEMLVEQGVQQLVAAPHEGFANEIYDSCAGIQADGSFHQHCSRNGVDLGPWSGGQLMSNIYWIEFLDTMTDWIGVMQSTPFIASLRSVQDELERMVLDGNAWMFRGKYASEHDR